MTQGKKPALRFKGFDNDWEQRKLGDVLVLLKDGTHGTHKDAESGPLLLSAKNIKDGTVHWDESDRRISEDEYNSIHTNFQLQKGDVLLTIVGSIGETAILSQSKGVTFQRSVAFLRPSDEISSEFLYSEIQGQKFQKELNDRKSTSAQPGIYLGDLGAIPIEFPTSDEEQTKVGRYFRNLDHLITFHQRKLEKLQNLKKAMLEKMFPKNGAKVPEIRFKGFTNDWEQRKLGNECFEIVAGGDVDKTKLLQDGKYPVIANALTDEGIIGYYSNEYRIKAPAVTVTGRGDVGHARARKINFTPVVRLLSVVSKHDVDFLAESINQNDIVLESTGVPQLTVPALANYLLCFPPTIKEEKRIGQYFSQLNHLLTLHQRKLEKLQNLKKAMLEKMFI